MMVLLLKYLFWLKKIFIKEMLQKLPHQINYLNSERNKKFKFLSFQQFQGRDLMGQSSIIKLQKTNRKLKGDIYLVDSGGQYEFGTTDVTRTISLKNSNTRIKDIFTRVLKGHIAVANFKSKKNTSGSEIDKSARKYLKQIGLNYAHGTGHGVGYF